MSIEELPARRVLSPQHLAALQAGRERAQAAKRATQPLSGDTVENSQSSIRRFTAEMMDDWFYRRLDAQWPGTARAVWHGRFVAFGMSNEYLPLCNDRAVLLAQVWHNPLTARPVVIEILAWSRDVEDDYWLSRENSRPLIALYNHCRRWLTGMRGERMVIGVCSDVRGDALGSMMLGDSVDDGGPLVDVGPYRR